MSQVTLRVVYLGKEVEVDIGTDTDVGDIDTGMRTVSALYAWYGTLQASEQRKADELDAKYRYWRSTTTEDRLTKYPKDAEWKVKTYVESQPKFVEFKTLIAKLEENASVLSSAMQALQMKGEMLRSIGARNRVELDATGMTTKTNNDGRTVTSKRPRSDQRSESVEEE